MKMSCCHQVDPCVPVLVVIAIPLSYLATISSSQDLYFGLLVGDQFGGSEGALSGIQDALNNINERTDLLAGYTLKHNPIHLQVKRNSRTVAKPGNQTYNIIDLYS